jgi:hypothetical protein
MRKYIDTEGAATLYPDSIILSVDTVVPLLVLCAGDDDRLYYTNTLEECAVISSQHLARAAK